MHIPDCVLLSQHVQMHIPDCVLLSQHVLLIIPDCVLIFQHVHLIIPDFVFRIQGVLLVTHVLYIILVTSLETLQERQTIPEIHCVLLLILICTMYVLIQSLEIQLSLLVTLPLLVTLQETIHEAFTQLVPQHVHVLRQQITAES